MTAFWTGSCCFPEIGPCIADDGPRRLEEETGDSSRDNKVWPRRSGPRDKTRCNDDADIADGVIAGEQPNRSHVRITGSVRDKGECCQHVDDEGDKAEPAHEFGRWLIENKDTVDGACKDAQSKHPEKQTLDERRAGTPSQAPADCQDTDESDQPVPKEIARLY